MRRLRFWIVLGVLAATVTVVSCRDRFGQLDHSALIIDGAFLIDAGIDSGSGVDAAAGTPDAGTPDAGTLDASPPDASPPDASPPDGGIADGGIADGGITDGGPTDGGPIDGGPIDAPIDAPLDAPNIPPGVDPGGSGKTSFYACATGSEGALGTIPLLLAIIVAMRGRRRHAADRGSATRDCPRRAGGSS